MTTTTTKTVLNYLWETHQDAAIDVIGIIETLLQDAMRACQTTYRGEVSDPDFIAEQAEKIVKWAVRLGEYADDMPRTPTTRR